MGYSTAWRRTAITAEDHFTQWNPITAWSERTAAGSTATAAYTARGAEVGRCPPSASRTSRRPETTSTVPAQDSGRPVNRCPPRDQAQLDYWPPCGFLDVPVFTSLPATRRPSNCMSSGQVVRRCRGQAFSPVTVPMTATTTAWAILEMPVRRQPRQRTSTGRRGRRLRRRRRQRRRADVNDNLPVRRQRNQADSDGDGAATPATIAPP